MDGSFSRGRRHHERKLLFYRRPGCVPRSVAADRHPAGPGGTARDRCRGRASRLRPQSAALWHRRGGHRPGLYRIDRLLVLPARRPRPSLERPPGRPPMRQNASTQNPITEDARWRTLLPVAMLMVALLAALTPGDVSAHAAFDRSDPQPNTVLAESPAEIRIWFTEPLEEEYNEVRLFDETGHEIPNLTVERGEGDKSLVVPISEPLANGTYSVVWKNLSSADGHPAQGYFTFTVGTQADVATVTAPVADDSTGAPLWLQSVARWLVLLALAAAIAVWPVWLLVLWPAIRPSVIPGEAEESRSGAASGKQRARNAEP